VPDPVEGALVTRVFDKPPFPSLSERQAILDEPVRHESFAAAFARLEILHGVEVREPASPAQSGAPARIVFWNAERLKYLDGSIRMLTGTPADVLVLCELDVGMARTGNRHTVEALADALGAGYVFGAEFVELGLGDLREQAAFAGQANDAGLHGAGFVSRCRLRRPALVRLETSGRWFDGAFHERRVGGRIAMLAELDIAGTSVVLVTAHYESHTDTADRLLQTRVMLDAVDAYAPGRPVLIGGDFNTSTFTLEQKRDEDHVRRALAADPHRLVSPQAYEPMFALLKDRGYDWDACNVPGVGTQRTRPDGTPKPPFGKIDWLFARGLRCTDAAVLPAVDRDGVAVSDHEALAVTIAPNP
jgi:endonuclease/exonuclease/phosphatase family metal-dependent hydrolase